MAYDKSLMLDELESLKGQQVEVVFNTLIYRGMLTGASEDEVFLKTAMEWVTLPMEGITQIRKAETP